MQIKTERFGTLNYELKDEIEFPNGIPGLEQYRRYILFPADEEGSTPFYFLQSTEDGALSFFLLDVFAYFPDYSVHIDDAEVADIGGGTSEDIRFFTFITVRETLETATTNLKAPILIHNRTQKGKQVVMDNTDYMIRQPLFDSTQLSTSISAGRG